MFENTYLPDVIEFKNVCQSYYDPKRKQNNVVIKDMNLLIEDKPGQGQFVVILGKSGCGKSTILRHIAGLQQPTSGEILINGKPRTRDFKASMIFQRYSSFPWLTVYGNVEFGLKLTQAPEKERKERVTKMIETVGLTGHENKYPSELSGGQQQRVAIARSLLCNAHVLLVDEPFSALDIKTRLGMQEFLRSLWMTMDNITVIMVTHDIPEAVYLADEVWVMGANPGRIIDRIPINLPMERSKDIKRSQAFIDYVYQLEDRLYEN